MPGPESAASDDVGVRLKQAIFSKNTGECERIVRTEQGQACLTQGFLHFLILRGSARMAVRVYFYAGKKDLFFKSEEGSEAMVQLLNRTSWDGLYYLLHCCIEKDYFLLEWSDWVQHIVSDERKPDLLRTTAARYLICQSSSLLDPDSLRRNQLYLQYFEYRGLAKTLAEKVSQIRAYHDRFIAIVTAVKANTGQLTILANRISKRSWGERLRCSTYHWFPNKILDFFGVTSRVQLEQEEAEKRGLHQAQAALLAEHKESVLSEVDIFQADLASTLQKSDVVDLEMQIEEYNRQACAVYGQAKNLEAQVSQLRCLSPSFFEVAGLAKGSCDGSSVGSSGGRSRSSTPGGQFSRRLRLWSASPKCRRSLTFQSASPVEGMEGEDVERLRARAEEDYQSLKL